MKKRVSSLLGIGLSVVAGWCSLTVALAALFSEEVDCCPVDQLQLRDPQVPRYPQNAQVTVYIDKRTGFTGPEKQAIKDGIENWNNQPNNSGVTFTFTPQPTHQQVSKEMGSLLWLNTISRATVAMEMVRLPVWTVFSPR